MADPSDIFARVLALEGRIGRLEQKRRSAWQGPAGPPGPMGPTPVEPTAIEQRLARIEQAIVASPLWYCSCCGADISNAAEHSKLEVKEELAALRADKARLDWLELGHCDIEQQQLQHFTAGDHIRYYTSPTIRGQINEAMQREAGNV